ncbi:MAG: hypothetical protein ACJ73E_14030 [Mycobacteriales bacterium]
MGPSDPALAKGLLGLFLAAVLPVLIVWVGLHLGRIGGWAVALLRRCKVLRPAEVEIPRPPLEQLAADLRRLAPALRDLPRGTSRARQRGLLMAYDDVLVAAALALDVPHALDTLPPGIDRELERVRVEGALEAAGLRFSPRRRQDTP